MGEQSGPRCFSLFVVVLVSLLSLSLAGSVFGVPSGQYADHQDGDSVFGVDVDPDNVLLQSRLQANGTGSWRVEYRIRLDSANTTESFEEHRESIESNPGQYREAFATDMRATLRTAENATGRNMSLSNVTVRATRERLPQEYGIIVYTFQWHGFATANSSSIMAGDALQGLFLDQETTYIVTWPARYNRVTVEPMASEQRANGLVWRGPMHFAQDQPRVVVSESAPEQNVTTEAPNQDQGLGEQMGGESGVVLGVVGIALVGIVGVVGAVYFDYLPVPFVAGSKSDTGGVAGAELLSNEEQVQQALENHAGRMKQQELAETLDWTDAKTSKVVRQMREADAIETFRIGRENVVTLPDTDAQDSDT